jgi:predicted AlkP superfamily phosphohydrolase/phosphomutase
MVLGFVSLAWSCQKGLPEGERVDRVVMVSYDGVGADLARGWIESGVATDPDGLTAMEQNGLAAERLRMVNPTLTSVNHLALVTGKQPSDTGVVSNTYHTPDSPIGATRSGFSTTSDTDTLWVAARRQGVPVGILLWPGVDAGALDRMGDFGVLWPDAPLVPSAILDLDPSTAGTTGELMSKDGVQPLVWSLEIDLVGAEPAVVAIEVAAYDGAPDGQSRYDTLAARRADEQGWRLAGEREWFQIVFEARSGSDFRSHRFALWCKSLHLDRFSGGVRFYRGAGWRLKAYPDEFEDRLTEVVGPWPGLPDEDLLEEWWLDYSQGIDLDTFLEQIERLDRYLDSIAKWVIAEQDFRLLLAYHPGPDEYQHTSLIVEPDQWSYSPGKAVAAREGLKRVGRSVDRSVGELWRALDGERTALVVVSDHGHVPIHDVVNINSVLADEGLLEVVSEDGRTRVAPTSPMVAVTSGANAHIYLNLEGREPEGVVSRADAHELLARTGKVLADLTQDGEPIVERAFTRVEARDFGLDHPSSGDLIAFLRPGFAFSWTLSGPAIEPSRYYGQHGYLATHDALCGMLSVRGAGVKRGSRNEIHATEVAPLVARWIGFELR